MKYYSGLILSVSSIAVLVCVAEGSESNFVSVTANVSVDNGSVCPEATALTCRTFGLVGSSSLRWTDDMNMLIDAISVYNFQESDQLPLIHLAENRSSAFISYEIQSADFNPNMLGEGVNFTAVLVVNPELLLSSGYPSLHCGGLVRTDNFTINQIDREIPVVPGGAGFHLVYDSQSYLLQQFRVRIERPVYSSDNSCQYKEGTYFNATLLLIGDTASSLHQVTNVTDASCPEATCLIQFQDIPEPSVPEDIRVSVTVGNRFGESAPTTFNPLFPASVQPLFNLSVSYVDCQTRVVCTVFRTTDSRNCTVRYGTDPSFENLSQTSLLVNESSLLSGLEDRTVYYIEAIFTSEISGVNERYYCLRTTYETGGCRSSVVTTIVGVVVGAAVLAVLFMALVVIIIILVGRSRSHQLRAHAETEGQQQGVDLRAVNPTHHEPDVEYAKPVVHYDPYHGEIQVDPEHRDMREDKEEAYTRLATEDLVQETNQYAEPSDTLTRSIRQYDTVLGPSSRIFKTVAVPIDALTVSSIHEYDTILGPPS